MRKLLLLALIGLTAAGCDASKEKLNTAISALAKAGKFEEITSKYPDLVGKMTLPK